MKKSAKTGSTPKSDGAAKPAGAKGERSGAKRKKLQPLTGIARELFMHVLNSIAFERYGECCAVDEVAGKFAKTPGRLQPAIRKLVEQGYVTVEGNVYPILYPTVAALRRQDPKLSKAEAERILAKVKRHT
jgi:hypothetical protein